MNNIKSTLIEDLLTEYYRDSGIVNTKEDLNELQAVLKEHHTPEIEKAYILVRFQAIRRQCRYDLLKAYIATQPEYIQQGLKMRYKLHKSIQTIATTLIMTSSTVSDLNKGFCRNAYDYVYLYKLVPKDIYLPTRLVMLIDTLITLIISAKSLDPENKVISRSLITGYEFMLNTYQKLNNQIKHRVDSASDNARQIFAMKIRNPHEEVQWIACTLNFAYSHISRTLNCFRVAVAEFIINSIRTQLTDNSFDITKSKELKELLNKNLYLITPEKAKGN